MYIVLVFFILSSLSLKSEEKTINIYCEILGYSPLLKPTLEYNVNSFELFGGLQTTYLTLGASMFGLGYRTAYSSPIVGINHVIGDEFGVEFGASYFRQYKSDFYGDFVEVNSMYELDNYDALGFNVGLREYSDSFFFRINYTPLYNLTDKEFRGIVSFSFGWGF
ncbi:MAG: hypothetical protein ACE364_08810 [Chlorobiota bacterium]